MIGWLVDGEAAAAAGSSSRVRHALGRLVACSLTRLARRCLRSFCRTWCGGGDNTLYEHSLTHSFTCARCV